jgi:outer membrane protein assembly factor BamB
MTLRFGVAIAVVIAGCGGATNAGPAPDGTLVFARAREGAVVPGPVLARDGSVLAASNAGILHSLDPKSGRDRWTFDASGSYGVDLSTSPLVRRDGTILWPGPGDRLYALDDGGRRLWSRGFASMPLTPAAGRGDTVYVMEATGVLHALTVSARGVRERWRIRAGTGTSYGSPAVDADGHVYTTVGRELIAVEDRGHSGHVAWRFAAAADVEVSPAVAADGTIVLGTNERFQYGVGPDGQERWRVRRDVWTYSSPLATPDGLVRYGDHRGRVFTVDAATGRVRRVDRAHGQVWTRPAVDARGTMIVGTHAGEIFGFARDGRRLLHLKTGGSVESYPVSGQDGTTYIGSEDGRLYAVRPTG